MPYTTRAALLERRSRLVPCLAVLLVAGACSAAVARPAAEPYVYAHHAVTTEVGSAQAAFDRGLTLIYAYQEEEAERAFRQAARLDPSLAMAWWGVALSLGPDINTVPEPDKTAKAAKAIKRARRLAASRGTAAEQDYIEALAARYSDAPAPDFDALALAYRDSMRLLTRKYPRDPDAAALFAEALMDVHPWRLWNTEGQPTEGTSELVAVIEAGLREHPEHIGLEHFYIHAVEASPDPGRALVAARRLAADHFEAAAAHLVHMPAHTFLRVGDWAAAERANEHAVHHALDFQLSMDSEADHACAHCLGFLVYAYAMEGKFTQARAAAESVRTTRGDPSILIELLARFGRDEELLAIAEPGTEKQPYASDPHAIRATWHYGRAIARLAAFDVVAAASELEGLRAEAALAPPVPVFAEDRPDLAHLYDKLDAAIQGSELRIEELSLVGRIALARGDLAAATMSFRNAVEVQDHGQYSEPPPWLYPVRETLAAALVRAGANEEAIEVLTECLRRTPHDPRATLALHQLLLATGRTHEARSLEPEIAAAQARAEQPLAALEF